MLWTRKMTISTLGQPSEAVYRLFGPRYQCAYCGDPADNIDHTTPRWFVKNNPELIKRFGLVKVHSCWECNNLAGKIVDRTWQLRKRRIARAVRKRHFRILQTASWTPEEIGELGPLLRQYIGQSDAAADRVRKRLRVLDHVWWPEDVPSDLQYSFMEEPPEMEE
jgi:hypothetical protein